MATHKDKSALVIMSREIAQSATGMAPGVMNYLEGRPSISPSIKLFYFLLSKTHVDISVNLDEKTIPIKINSDYKNQLPTDAKDAISEGNRIHKTRRFL